MRFNPKALILFVAFCLLIVAATSSGGDWLHAAEAATSALILFSVAGMFRDRRRAR
jgi:threonine/homoserine/homoserine lactone efflux protein